MHESSAATAAPSRLLKLGAAVLALPLAVGAMLVAVVHPHSFGPGWIVVFAELALLPSYGLASAFDLGQSHFERLMFGLPMALGVQFPLFGLAATLHWETDTWATLAIALSYVVFVVTLKPAPVRPRRRISFIAATMLLVIVAGLAFINSQSGRDSDDWAYTAFVADIGNNAPLMASDPVLGPDVPAFPRQSLNLWLGILGVGARSTDLSVADFHEGTAPILLVVAAILSTYLLGKVLGRNSYWGVISVFVLAMWFIATPQHSEPGSGLLARIQEDKYMALLVLAPLVYAAMLQLTDRQDRRTPIFALIAGVGLAAIHPMTFTIVLVGLWAWTALTLVLRLSSFRLLLTSSVAFTAAAAIPLIAAYRMGHIGPAPGTDAYKGLVAEQFQNNTDRVWIRGARIVMVHPKTILDPLTLAMSAVSLLIPVWKRTSRTVLLSALTLATVLTAFDPLVAPLLANILGIGMLWRFTWLLPVPYALAGIGGVFEPFSARVRTALSLTAFTVIVGIQVPKLQTSWDYWSRMRHAWRYDPPLLPLYEAIDTATSDGEVVLAPNLPIGLKIPTFAPDARLVAFRGYQGTVWHMPRDRASEGVERVDALDHFYDASDRTSAPTDADIQVLNRYSVQLVVLSSADPRLPFFEQRAEQLQTVPGWVLFRLPTDLGSG